MNNVNKWAEAISTLPDKQFFNTMRLYLGEIKTPYNKQRLIEQLAGFIRREENTQAIITLLDEFDVKLLTAITLIPNVTKEILTDFFTGTYTFSEVYSEIVNLKERLIVYSETDEYTNKEYLRINPLLEEKIKPYLNTTLILPDASVTFYSMDDSFAVTPNFLAAFISYIRIHGISCKSDGTIKKNDLNRLEEIFPGKINCIQLLMNAFVNLSMVRETEKNFQPDIKRIELFANLSHDQQLALLCAASVSRFSQDGLKKEAQLLLDCLSSIPQTGYTRQTILRLAFLVGTHTEDGNAVSKKSRFSQILASARSGSSNDPQQNADLLDRMIDSAIEFGLIQALGKDDNQNQIYINPVMPEIHLSSTQITPKVLNIDSTSTVTLMPGLSLKLLLPLTSFLMIKKCAVVTEFEVTKQSVSSSLDEGWIPQTIFDEITKYTNYEIPNNLKVNISEWYTNYSAATIYHGYILKVTDTNISFAENNPNIKKYIKEKLADGIYLLNVPPTADISTFIEESGLEFLGQTKTANAQSEYSLFPKLREGHNINMFEQKNDCKKTSIQDAKNLLKQLEDTLNQKELEPHQKESLVHRINNRLILTQQQLATTSVRTEIIEADGMDFNGKVHLVETAIKEQDMIELQLPSPTNEKNFFTLVGNPLSFTKQPGEAIVRLEIEPTHEIENILVSRITHLRRLKF